MSTHVLPGDLIPIPFTPKLKLGPGLRHLSNVNSEPIIFATRAGELKQTSNSTKWWVESNSWRYIPATQESVIGLITGRAGADGFRVDIGSAHLASLDALAFEGATKRNRPNLKVGSLVYARVSLAHKDMDPELECFDATTRKADGFGELKGGFVINCSLGMCRSLLDPKHFLLPLLGSKFPLEAAVGTNGRVWFKTPEVRHTIAMARCIEAVDEQHMDEPATKKFLDNLAILL